MSAGRDRAGTVDARTGQHGLRSRPRLTDPLIVRLIRRLVETVEVP